MQPTVWWCTVAVLLVAVIVDMRSRRIPNWLSVPFLVGGIGMNAFARGFSGLGQSMAGIAVAVVVAGILCYLRGMGLGDLKLWAAVGAWIGPEQLLMALVVAGITGGLLAAGYAWWHGALGRSLDGAAELIAGLPKRGFRPHDTIALGNRAALSIPYAPAIAIGTIFSFLTR